jgi:hypothetical protein
LNEYKEKKNGNFISKICCKKKEHATEKKEEKKSFIVKA